MKLLSNQETGLTLPHAYEEIKGDMRKMQMRQQPETIKEKLKNQKEVAMQSSTMSPNPHSKAYS